MRIIYNLVRFLVPLAVLYAIGYYVSGFSALTFTWLFILSALIYGGDWLILRMFGKGLNPLGKFIMNFLVSTVVIFFTTLAIEGGQVPLGASLFAALIISLLHTLIPDSDQRKSHV